MPARCCVDNCMSGPFQLRAARVLFILNLDKTPMSVVGVMSMLMKMVVQQKDGSEFIVNVISNAGSYGYPYLQVIPVEGKVMTSGVSVLDTDPNTPFGSQVRSIPRARGTHHPPGILPAYLPLCH